NFLKNRSPIKLLNNLTLEEAYTGVKPKAMNLKIFECPCQYTVNSKKKKLDKRAKSAMFLGYIPENGSYKLWDLKNETVVISRDVMFNERGFVNFERESDSLEEDDDPTSNYQSEVFSASNSGKTMIDPLDSTTSSQEHGPFIKSHVDTKISKFVPMHK